MGDVLEVTRAKPLRNQELKRLSDELEPGVAEQDLGLDVDQLDLAAVIDDDHRIRRRVEHVSEPRADLGLATQALRRGFGSLALCDLPRELLVLSRQLGGSLLNANLERFVRQTEVVVRLRELLRGRDPEGARREGDERDRGRHGRRCGDRLDDARQPVRGRPERPDLHDVRGAARDDERAEAEEHPVEGDVHPLASKGDERERDRRVRERGQPIGDGVQPEEARVPEVAMPVRHEAVGREQTSDELRHDVLAVPPCA